MRKCIACICLVTVFCCAVLLGGCKPTSTLTYVDVPASAVSKTEFSYYTVGIWSAYLCGEWWIEQEEVGYNLTAHSLKTGETRLLVDTYSNEGGFTFEMFGNRALFNDCFDALHVVDMTKENAHYKVNSSVLAEDPYDACYIRQAFIHGDDVYIFHNNHFENSYIVERVSLIDNTAVKLLDISGSDTITYLDMRGDALCVYGTENGTAYLREYDRDGNLLGEYPAAPEYTVEEEVLYGRVCATDWRGDQLFVMRQYGVMVYDRTADGSYTKVGAMELNGSYSDTEGDYAFYWNRDDKTLCAFRFSTCTATSFTIPFAEEVRSLRVSDGGYLMLTPVPETEGARVFWYAVDLTAWF